MPAVAARAYPRCGKRARAARCASAIPIGATHLLFYEYFHGDNGAGIGASHQTGWTGVVAGLVEYFGRIDAQTMLHGGLASALGQEK